MRDADRKENITHEAGIQTSKRDFTNVWEWDAGRDLGIFGKEVPDVDVVKFALLQERAAVEQLDQLEWHIFIKMDMRERQFDQGSEVGKVKG